MTVPLDGSPRFRVTVQSGGEPYPREAVGDVEYLLVGGKGEIVDRGKARFEEAGTWSVELPRERIESLGAGANRLEVIVTSNRVALPRFASHAFATVPGSSGGNE